MLLPVLSAIVVNHRSHPLVNDCLRSLLAGSQVPDEIIVVDNEAASGGLEADLASDPRVRLVLRSANPGYAASCNDGAAEARGDLLLFLNADVTLAPECLERCLSALASDPAIGIVTPRLDRPDGSLDHACHRGLPTPSASLAYKVGLHRLVPRSRRLARYTMSWLDPSTDHDIEACSGAFMLIRRDTLAAAGGWDERYRFYAEDLDLCLRVVSKGGRIRYLGTARATHLKGAFSHNETPDQSLDLAERAVKRWAQREIVASHRLFFREHLRAGAAPPMRLVIELLFTLQAMRLDAADRLARLRPVSTT
ncbi:glycosyltransferase family 2 protein [soil metagenome]